MAGRWAWEDNGGTLEQRLLGICNGGAIALRKWKYWHVCGNTGLSKHGNPVFPHFGSLNQNMARVRRSVQEGGLFSWIMLCVCLKEVLAQDPFHLSLHRILRVSGLGRSFLYLVWMAQDGMYHGTHVADISQPYPSTHDSTKQ